MEIVDVLRTLERVAVGWVGWVLGLGARHPRLVLWAGVLVLLSAVTS